MREFKGRKNQRGFFGIAALVLGGIGVYQQYEAGQSAKEAASQSAAAQAESAAAQKRSANVQAQRDRLKQIREARIARARIVSSATQAGIGLASTGITGATGAVTSEMGSNIGAINVAQTFAEASADANQRAATWGAEADKEMALAAQWQTISGLGFQAAGKLGAWDKVFGPAVKPAGK